MTIHRIRVEVQSDYLDRLANTSPIEALSELIWNSLDADADRIHVVIDRNLLGGVESVTISDNGTGMSFDDARKAFAKLGGSSKIQAKRSPAGRVQHGRLGRGRLKAFALGPELEWRSTYKDPGSGRLQQIIVRGTLGTTAGFTITDPTDSDDETTGTTVTASGTTRSLISLSSEGAYERLTGAFALYLSKYPTVRIFHNQTLLDPMLIQRHSAAYPLSIPLESGGEAYGELQVVEWNVPVEKELLLCDEAGIVLRHLQPGVNVPGAFFTAYLKSRVVRDAELSGTLELDELDPTLNQLVTVARDNLRTHFRSRESLRAAELVEEWKREKVYPFEAEPADPVESIEREVFDILALNVHRYLPKFEDGDQGSRRFTFHLLKNAIESGGSSLQLILKEVVGLPKDKQDELAKLLERTTLSRIIAASKLVADRLDFLRGLSHLVLDPDLKKVLRERSQLHRIVAEQTWLFGEQFNLAADDESLTTVVKRHCADPDNREILDIREVRTESGKRGILDLMLCQVIRPPEPEAREHLVIELKRPSVRIDGEALLQVKSYANALIRDDRFRDTKTQWHFWALSTDMSDDVRAEDFPQNLKDSRGDVRGKVYVKTWGEIIQTAEARLRFYQEALEYRADLDSARDLLRKQHGQYLPDDFVGTEPVRPVVKQAPKTSRTPKRGVGPPAR